MRIEVFLLSSLQSLPGEVFFLAHQFKHSQRPPTLFPPLITILIILLLVHLIVYKSSGIVYLFTHLLVIAVSTEKSSNLINEVWIHHNETTASVFQSCDPNISTSSKGCGDKRSGTRIDHQLSKYVRKVGRKSFSFVKSTSSCFSSFNLIFEWKFCVQFYHCFSSIWCLNSIPLSLFFI